MKFRALTCIFAMTLFAALAVPAPLAAQEQKEAKKHHRYRFVDVGTFGGPVNYLQNDFTGTGVGVSGVLNNRGTVAGAADTSCAYRELRPYQSAFLWHTNRRSSRCTFPVGKHIGV